MGRDQQLQGEQRKPAPSERPSSDASGLSGSSAAADVTGSDARAENPFDQLPDCLVQRILGELEATEAFETSELHAIDRRFRRLVCGVHWKELRIGSAADPQLAAAAVDQQFEQLARRAIDRLQRGALLGAARVVVGTLDLCGGAGRGARGEQAYVYTADEIEACRKAVYALTKLLGALATGPVPLEEVVFDSFVIRSWPDHAVEEEEAIASRRLSLESVAQSFLVALSPAAALRSLVCSGYGEPIGRSIAATAGALSGAAPPSLRSLVLEDVDLSRDDVGALQRAWPALQRFRFGSPTEPEAMLQLAGFQDLRELEANFSEIEEGEIDGALCFIASSPCALRLRVLDLGSPSVGPDGLSAMLRLRALERVSIAVDHKSAGVIGGLADLPELRCLKLMLDTHVDGVPDDGSGIPRAAAAAIQQCRRLERSEISSLQSVDPAEAAALVRAARPSLAILDLYVYGENSAATSDFIAEVARGAPRLEKASVHHSIDGDGLQGAGIPALAPLLRLRGCTPQGRPGLSITFAVVPGWSPVSDLARNVIGGWFFNETEGPVKVQVGPITREICIY
eukprot:tig00000227_g19790.t1